jgi:hypothetical protein
VSIVLVFGAGASFGDRLRPLGEQPTNDANPPLTTGFFSRDLYEKVGYSREQAERDFREAFGYIRGAFAISDSVPVGEGRWASLNVEDVFTSIELDRDFHSPESDAGGRLTVIRNKLVRYLWRVIAHCTQYKYGECFKLVKSFVDGRDDVSVLTFNWDLLLDQEFMVRMGPQWTIAAGLYQNFVNIVSGEAGVRTGSPSEAPMFLKMHGSLNWFQCTNPKCVDAPRMEIRPDTQDCLYRARGLQLAGPVTCARCGTEMDPFLVPPLVRKPVAENRIIRAVWGQARQRLHSASKVAIIGFSAAPTDFYAQWLFRSTLGTRPREEVEIFVVNPQNRPDHEQHGEFKNRMRNMLPLGYNSEFLEFTQVGLVLARVGGV